MKDCQASARVVAQVRHRMEQACALHTIEHVCSEEVCVANCISFFSISASSKEQLHALQVAFGRRAKQGSLAFRVEQAVGKSSRAHSGCLLATASLSGVFPHRLSAFKEEISLSASAGSCSDMLSRGR